jgi:hypothetical protein
MSWLRCSARATVAFVVVGCAVPTDMPKADQTYGEDRDFLRQHTDCVELVSADGRARVAVVGQYQGRVMTSTARGEDGASFGWIRYPAVASKATVPHINVYGGEDRLWLGPEGGQFAIFFAPGDPFDLEHWQTPPLIDTDAYELVGQTADTVRYRAAAILRNWSGTEFVVRIERAIVLHPRAQVAAALGAPLPDGIDVVGYTSENTLHNAGARAWNREGGLLSIWILGMFKPAPTATVVVPFHAGSDAELGAKVNDRYFGAVPAGRLRVEDDVLFFSGDGRHRSKIGVGPRRCTARCGSYDQSRDLLTIVQFTPPPDPAADYVNSMWEIQSEPYAGDVINAYNDGPPAPGKPPLGPFYELETSSPALALAPGGSYTHRSTTVHLQGERTLLDQVARRCLGVGIDEIVAALPPR